MSDFYENEPGAPLANVHEYSVSEISLSLKRTVEETFSYVRVRGEISGFKRHSSGHCYMALKDDKAVLDAVIWRGNAGKLGFRPEDGLEVVATGKITTYPGRSKYQIVIDHMEPAGVGALMALLEERKKKLAAQGLFDPQHKRRLPFLPKVIGVVTSPTGAVIRDILHRLNDRCPRHVLVWPVAVQGEKAAEQITAAIQGFNALHPGGPIPRPDVLIVARGGGSLEDLWAFNEEIVVRAAAQSDIPLISAVGHETDTTLIDYASDKRAPTPTAAAEMAVPVMADLRYTLGDLSARHERAMARRLDRSTDTVRALGRAMPSLRDIIAIPSQRLDELTDRLPRALNVLVTNKGANLARISGRLQDRLLVTMMGHQGRMVRELERRMHRAFDQYMRHMADSIRASTRLLDSLSYERVLERGFAVVMDTSGHPVTRAVNVTSGQALSLRFHDGEVAAVTAGGSAPKKKTKTDKPEQGQLF